LLLYHQTIQIENLTGIFPRLQNFQPALRAAHVFMKKAFDKSAIIQYIYSATWGGGSGRKFEIASSATTRSKTAGLLILPEIKTFSYPTPC